MANAYKAHHPLEGAVRPNANIVQGAPREGPGRPATPCFFPPSNGGGARV